MREVIHAKRKVKRLRKYVKQKATTYAKSNFTTAIRDMRTKIKAAKTKYFTEILPTFLKSSPRKFWDYVSTNKRNKNQSSLERNYLCRFI